MKRDGLDLVFNVLMGLVGLGLVALLVLSFL
ncbi:hypothetical protein QO006_003626 [Deinococcus enclensis]|uniref:Uncharacterized protein n=1 Tax=Deinococcus enclensis TaxID=1049582 RepID=A0ABT9MHU0_9DEIO|nr:hypothetical protein [Deinococcus enclensis]